MGRRKSVGRQAAHKNSHLLPAKDQTLLHGWYPLFLLHALLYAGNLDGVGCVSGAIVLDVGF